MTTNSFKNIKKNTETVSDPELIRPQRQKQNNTDQETRNIRP